MLKPGNVWENFQRAYCFPENCNCELMQFDAIILQPMAFYSSFPFIVLGFYLFFRARKTNRAPVKRMLLGVNIIFIGVASCFLHASFIHIAHLMDFGFIFMFMAWVVVNILFAHMDIARFILVWAGLTALPTLFISVFKPYGIFTFAFLLVPILLLVVRFHLKTPQIKETREFMNKAVVCLIFAIVFVLLDRMRLFCFEDIFLHGHTLWHLLATATIYYMYKYFEYHQERVD